jgi:L-threonate 2-dehydrogenase
MTERVRVCVIGLGEVGASVASRLQAADLDVVAFDWQPPTASGIPLVPTIADAVAGAALVLSAGPLSRSLSVATEVAPLLEPGAVFADLSAGSPDHKKRLAALFPEGAFADLAATTGVGEAGNAALAASGTGARALVDLFTDWGLAAEFVSDTAGDAAARTLLRAHLDNGLAGVLADYLWAAKALGAERWAFEEVCDIFQEATNETARAYLADAANNVKRRQIEMMDIQEMFTSVAYESTTIMAAEMTYSEILHSKPVPFAKPPRRRAD